MKKKAKRHTAAAEEYAELFLVSEHRRLRLDGTAYDALRRYAASRGKKLPPYSERFRPHLEPRPGPLGPSTTMMEEESR